jgi:hypothetical protein
MSDQRPYQPPDDVIDAADQLLEIATEGHYDSTADERLIECRMCGKWDDHRPTCPVPLLTQWMKGR